MKYVICTVRDRAADAFGQPFFSQSLGTAIRGFNDAINNSTDPNNMMCAHPEDFDLFHLGFYVDQHATFELLDRPLQVAIGKDVLLKPTSLSTVARAVS